MAQQVSRRTAPGGGASDFAVDLGQEIRGLRRAKGLTLVETAALAGLSHPFLSQVERGLALPSMSSLHRIALALGTTQADLMSGAGPAGSLRPDPVSVVRSGEGAMLEGTAGGFTELLVQGRAAFSPMIFAGPAHGFEDFYQHPEDEFAYVITGRIRLDLDGGDIRELGPGDSVYYVGGTPHRWSGVTDYRLLVVKDHQQAEGGR
jgi:transcriptional regulator with XRE-family HTH domain